ncbi:MAG: L-threonylcarbamoyladenylate synthase [bacterium]|nr:L-threonylcarbamoyladenylate synthase [bacterium]
MDWNKPSLIGALKAGKIAVMPTDTIYGIVCRALNEPAVKRIYDIRKRAPEKPCIILIGDMVELERFSIKLSSEQKNKLKESWPGPVSVILDCLDDRFSYLHRGTKGLAFRIPAEPSLRNMLIHAGPLLAPSANIEGQPAAKNIAEAKNYFGSAVDLYVDGGDITGEPSRIIQLNRDGSVSVIRK